MFYLILFFGLFFFGLSFSLTEKNAKYILSGYNTMSEEERAKVDMKNFIPYFKRFHLFLAGSIVVLGLIVHYVFGPTFTGVFVGVYPILAYIYFIWNSMAYSTGKKQNYHFAMIILFTVAILVIGLFAFGLQEDKMVIDPTTNQIHLEGAYGATLKASEIESVSLVQELPKIKYKSNGFAVGGIRKGYFVTRDREKVKLIVNENSAPYLLIITKEGDKIYFSGKEQSEEELLQEVKQQMPTIEFK